MASFASGPILGKISFVECFCMPSGRSAETWFVKCCRLSSVRYLVISVKGFRTQQRTQSVSCIAYVRLSGFRKHAVLFLLNHAGSFPGFLHCAYSFRDGHYSLHEMHRWRPRRAHSMSLSTMHLMTKWYKQWYDRVGGKRRKQLNQLNWIGARDTGPLQCRWQPVVVSCHESSLRWNGKPACIWFSSYYTT